MRRLSVPRDRIEHLVFLNLVLIPALHPAGPSSSVSPVVVSVSLARVLVHPLGAFLALDVAAPMELALALVSPQDAAGVVPAPAAHDVATVGAHGSRVAGSPGRAETSGRRIRVAVIRRGFEVDEIRLGLLLERLVDGDEFVAALIHRDLRRRIVLLLQIFSDGLELLHGDPASADRAGAGNAVAFALQADEPLDGFAAGAVVVEIHEVARVFASLAAALAGVDEEFGEFRAVADVVRAAAPLENALLVATRPAAAVVALAMLQLAFAAAARDAVDDGGRGNRVNEGGLAGTA